MSQTHRLTPKQEAMLPEWNKRWVANATSTAPMTSDDQLTCAEHVRHLYQKCKLPPPVNVGFMASPFGIRAASLVAALVWKCHPEGWSGKPLGMPQQPFARYVASGVWAAVSTPDNRECPIVQPTDAQLQDVAYTNPKRGNCGIPSCDWYYAGMEGTLREVGAVFGIGQDAVRELAKSSASDMWHGGNTWSGWDCYLSFFQENHIVTTPAMDIYEHWKQLSLHSGPRCVHEKFVMFSDRPLEMHVDDRLRLHAETVPAITWRDGTCVWVVGNVRVPGWVVERPDEITLDKLLDERNAEVRRVMMQRMGRAKDGLDKLPGVEEVHRDDFGILYRYQTANREPVMFVKVINATPEPDGHYKEYMLFVSNRHYGGLKTARAAVASTWRNKDGSLMFATPEEYNPVVET